MTHFLLKVRPLVIIGIRRLNHLELEHDPTLILSSHLPPPAVLILWLLVCCAVTLPPMQHLVYDGRPTLLHEVLGMIWERVFLDILGENHGRCRRMGHLSNANLWTVIRGSQTHSSIGVSRRYCTSFGEFR